MFRLFDSAMLFASSTPVETMIKHAGETLEKWFSGGTTIIGYIILFVGIMALLAGIWSIHKGQPNTKAFIVAILALIIGGYLSFSGFNTFKNLGKDTGQNSVNELLGTGK